MLLRRFRVTNYKSIIDSGWVVVDRVTALVGKNESGKTTILEALRKFCRQDEAKFAPKDFPRSKSREYNKETVCVAVEFSTDSIDREVLKEISPAFEKIETVTISKTYENLFQVDPSFPPEYKKEGVSKVAETLRKGLTSLLGAQLANVQKELDQVVKAVSNGPNAFESASTTFEKVSLPFLGMNSVEQVSKSSPSVSIDFPALAKDELTKVKTFLTQIDQAEDLLLDRMPSFVYFEEYDILDGKVNLAEFSKAKEAGPLTGKFKTMDRLLTIAGLDYKTLIKLNEALDIESRNILCTQASTHITGLTSKYWSQRTYFVSFRVDGPILATYVTDNIEAAPIALEDRSKGFKTQFSFNIIFNAATQSELKDSVLLLDEPGLHLHASAQADFLQLIEDLTKHNQIIYATHSPFLIDPNHLEIVRICREDYQPGSSQVTDRFWSGDDDSIFPLLSALGYQLSQSLFIGSDNLILEGITDYWYLGAISERLRELGKTALAPKIKLSPVGGASKVYYMAVFMRGQKLDVVALLDSESEGRKVKEDLVKNRILTKKRVILVSEPIDPSREMDMEDFFPTDFYLSLVQEAYAKELAGTKIVLPLQRAPRIVVALTEYLKQRKIEFHKTRPARLFLDKFPRLAADQIPPAILETSKN